MKLRSCLWYALTLVFALSIQGAFAQGTTSSRITGSVVSEGEPLIGATVLALHTPTGFQYGTTTNSEGLFILNNVNVGGPYKITVSYTGYESLELSGLSLSLGQTENLNLELSESVNELQEIIVTAGGKFDGNQTGSETKISEGVISTLPTADRGLNDYLRITPQADVANNGSNNSGGISFAGVNNRFNAIFVDGAVNNDVFGLANSGTNGGQAGISPISPDAIEQIQVVLAPYDVTLGGFAGGGINAVTRSGTNELTGSAYWFTRNEDFAGKTPTDIEGAERTKLDDFSANTFGFRLGGPLIKNKLFFFTNVEIQRDELPRPFIEEEYLGDANASTLEAIRQKLISDFGYDPGGFSNNPQTIDGEKVLLKLDYNINDNHKLTARHSYVKGTTEIHPAPSATRVVFNNVGYIFPSTTNSSAIELKSIFGSNMSNNLIVGLTTVRDERDILGDPFPQIIMADGPAQVVAGTDNFSYSNVVNQDVFTITNNFNLFKGKHSLTFGTHNEFFQIENLFTIFSTPRYEYFFDGVNRFLNGENADLSLFGHEQAFDGKEIRLGDDASNLGPSFNAMQLSVYGQDEIQVNRNFKLTLGLRLDVPIFSDDPPLNNTAFNENTIPLIEQAGYDLQGARASQAPATQLMFSPRVGFNYDVSGDKTTQLRGGAGIFTSRVPWVWPGGMFIRNGLNSAFNVNFGIGEQEILADPAQWINNLASDVSPAGDVDLFVEDFKYPQILRASLAVDQKLPWDLEGTLEFTYTKTLNNMLVQQVNVKPSTATLGGADNRPVIDFNDLVDPTYQNITLVSNTNEGYTYNVTAQLTKAFSKNTFLNLAYSFTRAEAVVDGRGFINNTNWENILSVQGNNNPSRVRSTFDVGSRITAFLSHRFEYSNNAATTLSLFFTGRSGQPYSYVYNNPISDIASSAGYNDLIYVPASQSEINLVDITDGDDNVLTSAAEQWSQLDNFIDENDYLSERRGDYVDPNEIRTPFETVVDLKLTQDFFIETSNGTKHNFQLTFDIFNFTNLLNQAWGRRYFVGGNVFPLIQANRNDAGEVEYNFTDPGNTFNIVQSGTYSARWLGQLGLRYSF
ncbi:MAG: TonB-dependent receptor [Bacteroidota bacterium]